MEEAGFVINTAASHQGAIETLLAYVGYLKSVCLSSMIFSRFPKNFLNFESTSLGVTEAQHLHTRLLEPNELSVKRRYHRLQRRLDSPPPPHASSTLHTDARAAGSRWCHHFSLSIVLYTWFTTSCSLSLSCPPVFSQCLFASVDTDSCCLRPSPPLRPLGGLCTELRALN